MNYRISITSQPPRFLEKIIGKGINLYGEKRLGSEDFNDEIIVYNLFSRKMPLVTFDKLLQKRYKDLEFRLLSSSFSWNLYHFK